MTSKKPKFVYFVPLLYDAAYSCSW